MKTTICFLIIFCACSAAFAQNFVYDTSAKKYPLVDFSFQDDLTKWTYAFKKHRSTKREPAVGYITLWRTEWWDDAPPGTEFRMKWRPEITFSIYELKDSAEVRKRSNFFASFTSLCGTGNEGGDIVVVGNYLFMGYVNCVNCYRRKDGIDYCRPTVNRLLGSLDPAGAATISEFIRQLPIQEYKK